MYDAEHYLYDKEYQNYEAGLKPGAYLYRLTSIHFCHASDILSGNAPLDSKDPGRFNEAGQRTTYASNNVLVCIAEVLFHRYRTLLNNIKEFQPSAAIRMRRPVEKVLAIVRVGGITELVFIDTQAASLEFDRRMCGTSVIFPDSTYEVFYSVNRELRQKGKRGAFYPSARHSRDFCVALFRNETGSTDPALFESIYVRLQLVPEDQAFDAPPRECQPYADKLHATMGYYCFLDVSRLERLRASGALNPADIPSSGYVDFVRRHYRQYPTSAVCGANIRAAGV
ncbi:MAG: RES family NAD+ phosphorylase [bacterium]|nr:RES family NAD+ phosphorylase [bacterium]